jgi:hypothetical protein
MTLQLIGSREVQVREGDWERINDDLPGNGSGAFQCLIQVYRDM